MANTFLAAQRHRRWARAGSRRTSSRSRAALMQARRRARRGAAAAGRRGGRRQRSTPSAGSVVDVDAGPRRRDGARHRPAHGRSVPASDLRRAQARVLERPDGPVRERRRSPTARFGVAQRRRRLRGLHRGRRRRQRRGGATRPASPTATTTSRPAAAPRSSTSKARSCPASRRCAREARRCAARSSPATGSCTRRSRESRALATRAASSGSRARPRPRSWSRRCSPRSRRCARRSRGSHDRRSPRRTCYWETQGAFTGEVSAPLLKDVGLQLRASSATPSGAQFFGETDEIVRKKARARARAPG